MKIYTRTGDDGSTGLGSRQRVSKASLRIETYGTVDELNAVIGAAVAAAVQPRLADPLRRIQQELFHLGADLCVPREDQERWPVPQIEAEHVEGLEALMDALDDDLEPLKNFILPGGTQAAAHLHVARTVARRAERLLVALAASEEVRPLSLRYLNRLSDALFVMARWENRESGHEDVVWSSES